MSTSSSSSSSSSSGIGFLGLLTILFIALKLTHYIDWSWWWVLSPVGIPVCLIVAFGSFYFLLKLVMFVLKRKK